MRSLSAYFREFGQAAKLSALGVNDGGAGGSADVGGGGSDGGSSNGGSCDDGGGSGASGGMASAADGAAADRRLSFDPAEQQQRDRAVRLLQSGADFSQVRQAMRPQITPCRGLEEDAECDRRRALREEADREEAERRALREAAADREEAEREAEEAECERIRRNGGTSGKPLPSRAAPIACRSHRAPLPSCAAPIARRSHRADR